ncbi:hypothetical protein BGZ76_004148 [Entomortierella beljakovae]|nr:hypothetical protein BGZ76_004148 [Entomortierella beljakovae]
MKLSALILIITSLILAALVLVDAADAAAVKEDKKINKNKNKNKSKGVGSKGDQPFKANKSRLPKKNFNNPHALSVEEERFSSCGRSSDVFRIQSISSNRHLCSGCKACINLEGFLSDTVSHGAKVRLEVSKYYYPLIDQEFDLCKILEGVKDGPKCPISPTSKGLRACLPLDSSITTDVSADLRVTGYTGSGKPLFCVEGSAMVESQCPRSVGPGSYACNH